MNRGGVASGYGEEIWQLVVERQDRWRELTKFYRELAFLAHGYNRSHRRGLPAIEPNAQALTA